MIFITAGTLLAIAAGASGAGGLWMHFGIYAATSFLFTWAGCSKISKD